MKRRLTIGLTVALVLAMIVTAVALADAATNQSININNGATGTNSLSVTVNVSALHCPPGGDMAALEVAFRNSTSDTWTVVHASSTSWPGSDPDGCNSGVSTPASFAWTLASGASGNRTVYARFKHANDEVFAQDVINFIGNTAPTIAVNDVTKEGNTAGGWTLAFGDIGSASDTEDGTPSVSCSPAIGSVLPLGANTVSCTATDSGGLTADDSGIVTVVDTTKPTIGDNDDTVVEATDPGGAVAIFSNPAASDIVDASVAVVCIPASGSTFPLEHTKVTCTATDDSGNIDQSDFDVWVRDTTPPSFSCGSADSIWHADNQSVACTASDSGSGLVTPASFSLSTNVAAGNETDSAYTGSQSVCDAVGNCVTAGPFGPFKIDRKAPSVSATPDRSADHNGWYNHSLIITFSGTDGGIGGVICDLPVTYSGPDNASASVSGSCADAIGNSASALFDFKYDGTAPTAALSVTVGTAGANGWYTSNVTVHTSGVGSVSNVTCTPDQFQTDETTGTTFNGSCTSGAGLTTNAAPLTVKLDKTGPTDVVLIPNGTLGLNGWYISNVTISTSGTDTISAPVICTTDQLQTTDTLGATFSGSCTNNAGLTTDASPLTIKRDTVAPTITTSVSPARPSSGWWNIASGAPTVSFACDDATSGVVACPASHIFGEGENQAYSGTVYDNAGHFASAGVTDIDIDLTAPTISASVSPARPSSGWWNIASGAPTVSFACEDTTSGIVACPASHTFGEGENQAYSDTVYDNAGNSASDGVTDIDVDLTAPSISAALDKDPAATGWFNIATGAPTVKFTCSDATSGLAGTCPADYKFLEGKDQSYSQTIYDNAGNSASAGVEHVKVDLTAPSITITTPANGASYLLNQSVASNYSCSDATSTVATCVGPVASGANFDTSSVGSKSFTVNATDVAGNTSTLTNNYTVSFKICALFDQTKSHKLGSTVPIKLQLCDVNGVNYSSASIVVTATGIYRLDSTPSGILDYDSGNANPDNNFRYDASLAGYIFNLSTKGLSKGTWKLTFTDSVSGTSYFVTFDVK